MTAAGWAYALAAVRGTGHARHDLPCQDAGECLVLRAADGGAVLAAVVADGAGSAPHGAAGAELACALFLDEMTALFESGGTVRDITRPFVAAWLTRFQHAVALRAEAAAGSPRDFACTTLAAVVGEGEAVFLQIGDGAIVVAAPAEPEEYCWIFWPQRGEYENVTSFATDPAATERFEYELVARRYDEVALFTDGIQRLALHFASQTAHSPFFRPLFAHLRRLPPGSLAAASAALAAFLDSPSVNERTDDDKTLLLATRRAAEDRAIAPAARDEPADAPPNEDAPLDDDPAVASPPHSPAMATDAAAALYDGAGRPIPLGPALAKGGEGSILPVGDQAKLVAKLYHEPVAPDKAAKLAAMVRLSTPRLLRLAAWPVGTLHDRPGGAVRGVLMPWVREGRELHLLYGPKTRRREFPDATLPFLVHAAANVARAFAVVHEHGHVIGDVNHGSVLVSKRATVTLVDCDSFQVRDGDRRYLCAVGVPTHTPPELQGRPFAGRVRTPNHDAFGLAVLIFQLLFLGRHPFSGGFLGAGELALERAIGEFRFAYGTGAAVRQMRQPPGTPPLEAASPPVAALFERAFAPAGARPAGRPSAREWAGALEGLAGQLTTCTRHGGHYYPRTLGACPWCAVEATTKLVLFNGAVAAPGVARPGVAFDLAAIWAAIAAVPDPGPPPPLVAAPAVAPSPAAVARGTTLRRARRAQRVKRGAAIVAIAGSSLAVLAANAPIIAAFGWLVALAAAVAFMVARAVARPAARARAEAEHTLRGARAHLDEVERRWREGAGNAAFLAQRRELESNRDAYRDLPALRQRRLQALTANPRQHQLQRHLDRHRIAAASIKGVGPGRKATLQSYGIETAADVVEAAVLRVPGFGPALTASLLAWRREIEGRFVFDPRRGVTTADSAEIEREIAATRARLEGALRRGPALLQDAAQQTTAVRTALRPEIERVRAAAAQAEADLRAL